MSIRQSEERRRRWANPEYRARETARLRSPQMRELARRGVNTRWAEYRKRKERNA